MVGTSATSTSYYQVYNTWNMGSYTAVCSRCKGSKKIKIHAPDCTDTACGKNCDKQETCDECKGTGYKLDEDLAMRQLVTAV